MGNHKNLKYTMKKIVKSIVNSFGYTIHKKPEAVMDTLQQNEAVAYDDDILNEARSLYEECRPYTMLSLERVEAIVDSIDYICSNNIDGDIVECGVWRGGAMYVAAKALLKRNVLHKKFYLFDTYDVKTFGSTSNETEFDKDFLGKTALDAINEGDFILENYNYHLDEVTSLLESTGYPKENFIYVVGRVEDTLPYHERLKISLLRLDTDWYESTKHELIHLYPYLIHKGVLLIDDYGFWQGSKKACDEYFSEKNIAIMLHRSDFFGRVAIKVDACL